MAPALVGAAVGALLAAALLGPAFGRRAVLAVVGAAVLPSLDAVLSLAIGGATNAAFHTLFLPALAGVALYWDANRGADSALRRRYGWRGVRIAWVALASYLVAGVGLALATDGTNLLYPVHDRFYVLSGELSLSSEEGVVQTYVGLGGDGLLQLSSEGTTASYRVESFANPDGAPGLDLGAERRFVLVESGWQVAVVATAAATLAARSWMASAGTARADGTADDERPEPSGSDVAGPEPESSDPESETADPEPEISDPECGAERPESTVESTPDAAEGS